jgi:hypothetical protein
MDREVIKSGMLHSISSMASAMRMKHSRLAREFMVSAIAPEIVADQIPHLPRILVRVDDVDFEAFNAKYIDHIMRPWTKYCQSYIKSELFNLFVDRFVMMVMKIIAIESRLKIPDSNLTMRVDLSCQKLVIQ